MKDLIYLASPYSSADQSIIEKRVMEVAKAAARLIENGHLIFSPILHSHPIADLVDFSPLNHSETEMSGWMKYDFNFIRKADELWVLMLEGWTSSHGVSAEIKFAKEQGKPVRYISFPGLTEFYEQEKLSANS